MSNPTVCAIMLVNGRPEMVARAVRSLREQTYQSKRLVIVDSGETQCPVPFTNQDVYHRCDSDPSWTVGSLRNHAMRFAKDEIVCHFDSDDWSHPRRIEEQVALLQASGKECVGYRDMLFWKECGTCFGGRGNILPHCPECGIKYDPSREIPVGDAWLYTNGNTKYALGTSLCYWRKTWERRPFADLPKGPTGEGEDSRWLREVDSLGVSAMLDDSIIPCEPRMIASVHGGNTSSMVALAIRRGASEMKRVPAYDSYARERMAL